MPTNPESFSYALILLVLITVLTVLGAFVILALLIVWRRSLTRQPEPTEKTEHVDTWSAAAERVRIRPSRPTLEQDADADASSNDDEESNDDAFDENLPYEDPPASFFDHDEDEEEDETYFSDEDKPYDPSEEDEDEDDSIDGDEDDDPQNPFGRR